MNKRDKFFTLILVAIVVSSMMTFACAKELPAAVSITLEQAEATAFEHAGVDGTNVVFSKEKLDKGVYELKFSDGRDKYEYEISAVDGQILDYEWDIEKSSFDTLASDKLDTASTEETISEEQARQTALEDAGLNEEGLKYVTCYVVRKRHVPYAYKVKFAEDTVPYNNYQYTIDLYTGDILDGGCVHSNQSDKQDALKTKHK